MIKKSVYIGYPENMPEIKDWLSENIDEGKFHWNFGSLDKINTISFDNAEDAMAFKLTFC